MFCVSVSIAAGTPVWVCVSVWVLVCPAGYVLEMGVLLPLSVCHGVSVPFVLVCERASPSLRVWRV